MIFVEMYGRLGNQLFRYAVARRLQIEYYPNEKLVLSFNQARKESDKSFQNTLEDFRVSDFEIYSKKGKVLFNESNLKQKIIMIMYFFCLKMTKENDMKRQVNISSFFSNTLNKMEYIGLEMDILI